MKQIRFNSNKLALCITAAFAISSYSGGVFADADKMDLNIKKQNAGKALMSLGEQAGVEILLTQEAGNQIELSALKGQYTLKDALDVLLKNSGLVYEFISDDTILVKESKSNKDEKEQGKDEEVEEIVVTGSRVARTPSQMAANIITLDAEALRATGQSTLEGALRQLPQNIYGATEVGAVLGGTGMSFNGALNITGGSSINLRGLGSESTLVLIDGRRIGKSGLFGGASDISAIPLNSVERVELMLDGASAIYGSDAVGGVVNIILKKDYDDTEITYEYGTPEAGGFGEHVLTLSGGTHWDSGRLRATFERFQRSNLDGAERPERIYWTDYLYPGRLYAYPALFYQYNGQKYLPSELVDAGLTANMPGVESFGYSQLPAGFDGTGPISVDDFVGSDSYDYDAGDGISLIPAQERNTLQVGFEQSLPWFGENVILSGSVYYSDRQTHAADGSFTFSGNFHQEDSPLPFESVTHSINWRVPGLAEKHYESDQQVARWHLALDGNVGESWRWQVAAGQSRDQIDSLYFGNSIATSYYSDTLLDLYRNSYGYSEEDIAGFDYRFTELVEAGLNIFATDIRAVNDPALLAQLIEAPQSVYALNRENNFEISANGSLFSLPGGDVHLALGADWREETLESRSERSVYQRDFVSNRSLPMSDFDAEASRIVRSAFTEVLLPLVGSGNAVTGIEQLSLTGAARYDSYNWFRSDSTWSLGMIWSPNDQIRVKANKSTSYVVPTPREALIEPAYTYYNGGTLWGAPIYDQNGDRTGDYEIGGVYTYGGNPNLQPENASTVSAGMEITPEAIPGLSLNATWHQTVYSNRIGVPPTPEFILGTDYVSKYQNLSRTEEGWLNWDVRSINYAAVEVAGVDYRLHYNRETAIGQFILTANIGYTGKYDRVEVAGDAPINEVADVGFRSRAVIPAYRYNANLGWYHRGLSVNLNASTSSKTVSTDTREGVTTRLERITRPALATDLLLSYDFENGDLLAPPAWLERTSISLKILNLLDEHPKYEVNDLGTGEEYIIPELNANAADPRGRMFHLSITKRF